MNVNDPLFTDLALKVIAGRASEAEQSELAARVADHPELEAELESLRADVAFAKEVLPLLGDERVKAAELPGYARARLQAAVKRSLGVGGFGFGGFALEGRVAGRELGDGFLGQGENHFGGSNSRTLSAERSLNLCARQPAARGLP